MEASNRIEGIVTTNARLKQLIEDKTTPNEIDAVMLNGEKTVLFQPLEPYETPDAIAMICDSYQKTLENEPKPFIKYMLGVILSCYREFEERITLANKSGAKSTSYDVVKEYAVNKIGIFTKQEALTSCPSLGSSSVESALKKLVADGTLAKIGAGRKTHYVRSDAFEK